jgi:hypothetical protein
MKLSAPVALVAAVLLSGCGASAPVPVRAAGGVRSSTAAQGVSTTSGTRVTQSGYGGTPAASQDVERSDAPIAGFGTIPSVAGGVFVANGTTNVGTARD